MPDSDETSRGPSDHPDHRRLGRELHLYSTDALIGAGMPLWLPRGAAIRDAIERYVVDAERREGFLHVHTPVLAKRELYELSGHWENFQDDMFAAIPSGEDQLVLRPMNCPHHALVYRSETRSHRQLPLRIAEMGAMFRDERSGVIGGLNRVRTMTLNDGHIFCTIEQVGSEVALALRMVEAAYRHLGIEIHERRLSMRGERAKYAGDQRIWDQAEGMLREALASTSSPWVEAADEAAFYGPKIDLQVRDGRGRIQTLSTVQVDFVLPERFGLQYIAPSGERHVPVMVHRSVMSTTERMLGHLLDIHGASLPPWIAPVQVVLAPFAASAHRDCTQLRTRLCDLGIRAEVWDADESISTRVRSAARLGVPWVGVVGDRERANAAIAVRRRGAGTPVVTMPIDDFVASITSVISRRLPTVA